MPTHTAVDVAPDVGYRPAHDGTFDVDGSKVNAQNNTANSVVKMLMGVFVILAAVALIVLMIVIANNCSFFIVV